MKIEFSSFASKFLKKSERDTSRRILKKIDALTTDPFPQDVKRVVNHSGKVFRVNLSVLIIMNFFQ